ncbi:MAG: radical SAM protein [Candidatus Pacearchaeota archaeon]|nr:radical SAM protein [Candidatus Pacearchaeota archaeon]
MRTLLINPPVPRTFYNREFYLPSGEMYLGAVLQRNNEEVRLIDLKTFQKEFLYETRGDPENEDYDYIIKDAISKFKPDLIGFGGLISGNFLDVLKFSKVTKNSFPEIPVVMGGAHASMYPNEILTNCPSIDWLVLGEGEDTLMQLIEKIERKDYNFEDIDGFAFRQDGRVVINPKTRFIRDLDSLPFPAYDLINLKAYFEDTSKWHNPKKLKMDMEIPIISSRSCPYDCNFCSEGEIMGKGWRPRSPKNVIDEIEFVYDRYHQSHFGFMDDNLTISKRRIIEICNEIKRRGLNIQFETHNGVSIRTLDKEILESMVSAGLTRIALPIESGSDYIRNEIMGKRLSREKIFETVKCLKKYEQVYTRAFFIMGMPEETRETLEDTYKMIQEIDVDRVHLTNIVPFPGSRVFEQALKDNLLVNLKPEELYLSDEMYQTNYHTYFIKPYQLELKDLREFRERCNNLIDGLNSRRR